MSMLEDYAKWICKQMYVDFYRLESVSFSLGMGDGYVKFKDKRGCTFRYNIDPRSLGKFTLPTQ